jgi:hypothetical protein
VRRKKRYLIFPSYPKDLPGDAEFLFQNEHGYVFRMTATSAETMKKEAYLSSGAIRKIKGYNKPKTPKSV